MKDFRDALDLTSLVILLVGLIGMASWIGIIAWALVRWVF